MSTTRPSHRSLVAAVILVILAVGLAGCGSDHPQPAALRPDITPTPSPVPTSFQTGLSGSADGQERAPRPTPSTTPAASLQAVAPPTLDVEPTANPDTVEDPIPTATSNPQPSQTSTPTPVASPTPEPLEALADGQVTEMGQIVNRNRSVPWGAESQVLSDVRGDVRGGRTNAAWLLPWYDGFLHIGHGATGGYDENVGERYSSQQIDVSSLLIRRSSNGLDWTEPSHLPTPRIHFPTPELEDWSSKWSSRWPPCFSGYCTALVDDPSDCIGWRSSNHECLFTDTSVSTIFDVVSTGDRLLLGSQWKNRVHVSVTSDLLEWETFEIVLDESGGIHKALSAASSAKGLAVGSSGWLLSIETAIYFDFISVLPSDIAESALLVDIPQWHFCGEGDQLLGELFRYSLHMRGSTDEEGCLLWEDETISWEQFREFGTFGNKGFQSRRPDRNFGSVWAAEWGENPVRSDLPRPRQGIYMGTCCMVIGTSEGYMAIENTFGPGYGAGWGLPTELYYSKDGNDWSNVQHTVGDTAWINSFFVLHDGVMLSSCETHGLWHPDDNTEADTWIVDSGGDNWRQSEYSELAGSVPGCPSYPSNLFHLEFVPELLTRVDVSRSSDGAMAKNNGIVIWFGAEGEIERLVFDE